LPFPEADQIGIPEATALEDRATEARPGGHINFFEDFEAREMHPEVPLSVPLFSSAFLLNFFMCLYGPLGCRFACWTIVEGKL
jgi:hypothetical protein